jgi:hypothetical protein
MGYDLSYELLHHYDAGQPGVTLPVVLRSGGLSVDVTAKLDTGATQCIFQRFYGEELGLDVERGEPLEFGTATGTFRAYGHEIMLSVLGLDFAATVYFAHYHAFNRDVLGRHGFLNRVLVGLDDYAGRLYLGRHNGQ